MASTSSSTNSTDVGANDYTLKLIKHLIADNRHYNLKLVPMDYTCDKCGKLENEKEDLLTQINVLRAQLTQSKDFIGEITSAVNFVPRDPTPNPPDVMTVKFQQQFKSHIEKTMSDYERLQNLMKRPLEEIIKISESTPTPLPSPTEFLDINTVIGTDTSASKSIAHNQPQTPHAIPTSRTNSTKNDNTTVGYSGARNCTSGKAMTVNSPDITKFVPRKRNPSSSKHPAASTSAKTVAPTPPRPESDSSKTIRRSSRPILKPKKYFEDSSDNSGSTPSPNSEYCPTPKRKRNSQNEGRLPLNISESIRKSRYVVDDDSMSYENEVEDDEDEDNQDEDTENVPSAPPLSSSPSGVPVPPVLNDLNQDNGDPDELNLNGEASVSQEGSGDDGISRRMFLKLAKCEYCSFKPGNIDQLKDHIREKHVSEKDKGFDVICRRCLFSFSAESFQSHPCKNTTK